MSNIGFCGHACQGEMELIMTEKDQDRQNQTHYIIQSLPKYCEHCKIKPLTTVLKRGKKKNMAVSYGLLLGFIVKPQTISQKGCLSLCY